MYEYNAKVIRVIDGDTITVNIDCGFDLWYGSPASPVTLRLSRINAPEKRTKDKKEKRRGVASMLFLKSVLEDHGGSIVIQTQKDDAFGRWLAEILVVPMPELSDSKELVNINDMLVSRGHAVYKDY